MFSNNSGPALNNLNNMIEEQRTLMKSASKSMLKCMKNNKRKKEFEFRIS